MSENKSPSLDEIRWQQQVRIYISMVEQNGITLENGTRYLVQNNVKYIVNEAGELTQQKATEMEVAVWNAVAPMHGLHPNERIIQVRARQEHYSLINSIIAFQTDGEFGGFLTELAEQLNAESDKLRAKHFAKPRNQETILREAYKAIQGIAKMRGIDLEQNDEQGQAQDTVAPDAVAGHA